MLDLKTSTRKPPCGKTQAEILLGFTRDKFVESCIKLDKWHKRGHKFSFKPFQPVGEKYACSALTIDEQFHNTLNRLRRCWTDQMADQLFWEMQIRKLRDHAREYVGLTDVMISTSYEDDMYLINDRVVMMRPCHKASTPETWAYVVMHEIGHHIINYGKSSFQSVNRANFRAFHGTESARKTKTYHISLFETEVVAWHEGIKFAKEAGVHIVDSTVDRVKTNCLLSYATLE